MKASINTVRQALWLLLTLSICAATGVAQAQTAEDTVPGATPPNASLLKEFRRAAAAGKTRTAQQLGGLADRMELKAAEVEAQKQKAHPQATPGMETPKAAPALVPADNGSRPSEDMQSGDGNQPARQPANGQIPGETASVASADLNAKPVAGEDHEENADIPQITLVQRAWLREVTELLRKRDFRALLPRLRAQMGYDNQEVNALEIVSREIVALECGRAQLAARIETLERLRSLFADGDSGSAERQDLDGQLARFRNTLAKEDVRLEQCIRLRDEAVQSAVRRYMAIHAPTWRELSESKNMQVKDEVTRESSQ